MLSAGKHDLASIFPYLALSLSRMLSMLSLSQIQKKIKDLLYYLSPSAAPVATNHETYFSFASGVQSNMYEIEVTRLTEAAIKMLRI
jgi:hypothetical protein